MEINTAGKWIVFAYGLPDHASPGEAVTGDAANITANIRIDGGAANTVDDTNPTELEDGYYIFDITAVESNGDLLLLVPASSTANVQVIAVPGALWTRPANFNVLGIASDGDISGNVDGNVVGSVASVTASVVTDAASRTASKADVSGLATSASISSLKDFDPATDPVATVTTLTNLPAITTNWLTATGIAASALDGKGDWNIGKTGYTLTQTFPANFSDFSITATTGTVTAEDVTLAAATHTDAVIPTVSTLTGHTAQTADHTANIAAILVDTGTTLPATIATIDGIVDTILIDTADLQANQGAWATATGFATSGALATVDGNVDAILVDTDTTIPALIAGVPTTAEFEARTPTAAQLAYITANSATGMPVTFTTAGGGTTTAVLNNVDGASASGTDDQYNGRLLVFTDGTLKGTVTDITGYVGSTTTATITQIGFPPLDTHNARLI